MNPEHAKIANPKLWIAEADGKFLDDKSLKCGYTQMRLIKEIKLPKISTEKLVEISIHLAVLSGYDDENFIAWAIHWINNDDRSESAAWAAARTAQGAARAAARAADFDLLAIIKSVIAA